MKMLIIIFVSFICTNTTPVTGLNGVYFRKSNQRYVNLGWGKSYPNTVTYYNTIKRNGVIVADNYFEQYNRISIPVESNFQSATFSVTQTVNGVESVESFVTVSR
jgi:hypothetical protein